MNVYAVTIRLDPNGPEGSPQGVRQVNTAAEQVEEATAKVRQKFAGCEVNNVQKICQIEIP